MEEQLPPTKSPVGQVNVAESTPLPNSHAFSPNLAPGRGGPQFDVGLVLLMLFKHKWKILFFSILGLIAAIVSYVSIKPVYRSDAKLLIKSITENNAPTSVGGGDSKVQLIDQRVEGIMLTEVEILTSMDLAEQIAAQVGPERILGNPAAATEKELAAEVLHKSLIVEVPTRGAPVIQVSYVNQDATLTQTVVKHAIDSYLEKHVAVHRDLGKWDVYLTEEIDSLRASLATTERELIDIKNRSGVDSTDDARKNLTLQSASLQQQIMAAEAQLAEQRAVLASRTGVKPSTPESPTQTGHRSIPDAKTAEYRRVSELLALLSQRERDYLLQYTPESLVVKGVRVQIAENEKLKSALESDFPELRATAPTVSSLPGTPTSAIFDRDAAVAGIVALETRIKVLNEQLERTRADLTKISEIEPLLTEMKRNKDEKEERLRYYSKSLQQAKIDGKLSTSMATNITVLEEPTPPARVPGTRFKTVLGCLVGGVALGLGIGVLTEFFLDRSVRRPAEIEESLGLPLFFSIPFVKGVAKLGSVSGGISLPAPGLTAVAPTQSRPELMIAGKPGVPSWSPAHGLRPFLDALRDRLVFYFEIRNFTRKPKLIAVSSCGDTAGVSTIASGLAASLSESGDGNVLLVDMNPGNQASLRFHKGELKCDLDDALEQQKRDDALVQNNLYVVSHTSGEDKLSSILPKRFTKLVPRLKSSDYDYIIFDLPPVNQISATPQLARYMDMLLMVVESEKTARETTKRVGAMFADNGVNFGVVLNKTRDYVPPFLRKLAASDT